MHIQSRTFLALAFLFALLCEPLLAVAADENPSARWEPAIAAFEAQDKQTPPSKGKVLFIGSSSIRKWDLQESFPDLGALNRGFGGSQIADSTHFAERIVVPYAPRAIVLYAGDNDIARGKTPKQVAADFDAFVTKVHAALPKTKVVFIAIKPSIARWELVGKMRRANSMIAKACAVDARLAFVDIDEPMLGDDGKPRAELFVDDGLHLSEAGYRLWTKLVKPHLATD